MMAREMMARPDEENKTQHQKAKKTAAEKEAMVPDNVTIDTFKSCDMCAGTVPECKKLAGTDKILRFLIDFGEGKAPPAPLMACQVLRSCHLARHITAIPSLPPRTIRSAGSNGMILTAECCGRGMLIRPDTKADIGSGTA